MDTQPDTTPRTDLTQPFSWQAPDSIPVQRGLTWHVIFITATLGLMLLALFVFKSWTFFILLPIMALALLLLNAKPPTMITYAISPKGVYVGDKLYDFSEFRSFGLIEYQSQHSAVLLPVRRFSPAVTLYFSAQEGEQVVDMLGARLPMQPMQPDILEKLIRIIKL
ncbi:MAG: hypothetical protein Q4B05_03685 [Candidatus Saccharibacteria bacterium]|nr:hypothetical protein [Candidatus Saccharibacteria bacterium]